LDDDTLLALSGKPSKMATAADAKGAQGGVDNFGRSLARGASFGLADDCCRWRCHRGACCRLGAGQVGLGFVQTSTAPSWSERYSQNLAAERSQDKAYGDNFPVWSGTGQAVGNVAATVPLMAARAALTATGPGRC